MSTVWVSSGSGRKHKIVHDEANGEVGVIRQILKLIRLMSL